MREVFGVTPDDSDSSSTDDGGEPTDPLDDASDTPEPSEPTTTGQGPVVGSAPPMLRYWAAAGRMGPNLSPGWSVLTLLGVKKWEQLWSEHGP